MYQVRATKIVDGDTFHVDPSVQGGNVVRIADYDAPEKGHYGYDRATVALTNLILNRFVTIVPKARDNFGRIVADVYLNGRNIVSMLPNS